MQGRSPTNSPETIPRRSTSSTTQLTIANQRKRQQALAAGATPVLGLTCSLRPNSGQ